MTREQLVADYKTKIAQDAETDNWTASDAAWEALSAWDNANREQLPAWRAGARAPRAKRYAAEYNGRQVLVTIPED